MREQRGAPVVTPELIKSRMEQFALGVLALTRPLLLETDARDMALQLRRSATAAYSNYGSACVARSHADFTSKIGIAYEEADESRRWLRLLQAGDLLHGESATALLRESQELRAILSSAHLTAKRNRDRYRKAGR
jgi:four helix bundle protein